MNEETKRRKRREFLKGVLAGSGAAVVAATAGRAVAAPATSATDAAPTSKESRGYRVTEHIAEYYKTAQF